MPREVPTSLTESSYPTCHRCHRVRLRLFVVLVGRCPFLIGLVVFLGLGVALLEQACVDPATWRTPSVRVVVASLSILETHVKNFEWEDVLV
jgi:hypothetical protein